MSDHLLSRKPNINSMNPIVTPSANSLAEALQSREKDSKEVSCEDYPAEPRSSHPAGSPQSSLQAETALSVLDSDDTFTDERDEYNAIGLMNGPLREVSLTSNPCSKIRSWPPVGAHAGPVIPPALVKGTSIFKVSKRRKYKKIFLVLDLEAAKITWTNADIRVGADIRQYRLDHEVTESEEARFFSILYAVADKSKSKVMHLIAEDEETFDNWVNPLDTISKHRQDLMTSGDSLISFDDEEIEFSGVERMCHNLHIYLSSKQLQSKFTLADTTKTGRLTYSEFQLFVREMTRREDIRAVYRGAATTDVETGMTWPEFVMFLRETQGEDVDADPRGWEAKFMRFARRPNPRDGESEDGKTPLPPMTEQAFAAYLTSTYNLPLTREPAGYSLDRPLHEYFISSSHNTYLLGRQVADLSSVEGYITALVKGCRSIEIDCWDGRDGQPQVQHGYAMTNAISFREVINIVHKYAFVASPFPLLVSLEVHCHNAQQVIMSDIMKEIFGSRLIMAPLDSSSDKLPSPSQLKHRVLIKVKAATPSVDESRKGRTPSSTGRRRSNSLTSPYAKPVAADNGAVPAMYLSNSPLPSPRESSRLRVGKRYNTITEGEDQETGSSNTSDNGSGSEGTPNKKKTSRTVAALGDLGVYFTGVRFDGFSALDCKTPFHILSFMEDTFDKHTETKEYRDAMYRYNMRFMTRVYPQFNRLTSHNFNPLNYWRKGVQMVALNWQTFDHGMQLNQAMFEGGTDQSGYVPKPHSMREIRMLHEGLPDEAIGKLERKDVSLNIDIISARQLMRPGNLPSSRTVDPYVEVEVFHANDKRDKHDSSVGIPIPTDTSLKYTTNVVRENGFNPVFDYHVKMSPGGGKRNERVAPIATYTAKLTNLKEGYRTLPLLDPNGDRYLFSTLFCRIEHGPVTSVYVNPGDESEPVGRIKTLGNKVFNRSYTSNPKLAAEKTTEKTTEKSSFDSGYSDGSLIRTV
ncbi:1-phosphatidylinositol 4 5-bisphosphate phosphodiesterase 1 [Apiospora marii]|uniref:Phosphoinositide phospholipase C n=1 Tax=Apiospora marii TaxID=335849 RepID=A0ABR1RLP9_9PEZI